MSRQLKLTLQYEGTRFHGWQRMPNMSTVQGTLEDALATVLRTRVEAHAAGRTDAGVHSEGQVVSITTPEPLDELMRRRLVRGVNALMHKDVVLTQVQVVPETFHARFSAIGKKYIYRIHNLATPPLFTRRFRWHVPQVLDVDAMQLGARSMLGEHAFDAFRAVGCQASHARRYLWVTQVTRHGDDVLVELRGNAFVRNQVRVTVGTLVEIGLGKRPPSDIALLLESGDRAKAGKTAPPEGLSLAQVYYREDALQAGIPDGASWPGWPHDKPDRRVAHVVDEED